MSGAFTYAVELLVGLTCLGLGVAIRRAGGPLRAVAVLLAIAGAVAVVHAVVELGQ